MVRIGPKEKKSLTPMRRYRFKNTFFIIKNRSKRPVNSKMGLKLPLKCTPPYWREQAISTRTGPLTASKKICEIF